jgi:phospholipid/cholesterol/gamma-HCH transport system substrate-binding protein
MAKEKLNNVSLGIFVLMGLIFLILTLYLLGKNKNLFEPSFNLKARFANVNGLRAGNNVNFAGIQVGTVKKVKILSDTLVEVTMAIDKKVKKFIMKNAEVAIGTEGLVGNKIVNINASPVPSTPADEGDLLKTKKSTDIEEMLKTLDKTNSNVALISEELKQTVRSINESKALWAIFNDSTLPQGIRKSVTNIRSATARVNNFADQLNQLITDVRNGKGTIGNLLTDTVFVHNLNEAAVKIKEVGENANDVAGNLNRLAEDIRSELNDGKGSLNLVMKDTSITGNIRRSLENIEQATGKLDTNMEAMRHHFLFRSYFKKLEKEQVKKEQNKN